MRLDVVIPTFQRPSLLAKALASLQRAAIPTDLEVNVVVVDNNSRDETADVVAKLVPAFGGRLQYLNEVQQGKSAAQNAGIRATGGDLVGMIDDDEEVHPAWFTVIADAFRRRPDLDFIGGPYLGSGDVQLPQWLPPGYPAVIGIVDGGPEEREYGMDYPGILMGGNAVIRRSVLDRVGLYNTALGRTATGLLSGEDDEMFSRLLAAGARGRYLPDLIIYHHVPPDRLTKSYHRRWCFWHGVSMANLKREDDGGVASLLGIPRHVIGAALRGLVGTGTMLLRGRYQRPLAFSNELKMWSALGQLYGRHLHERLQRGRRAAPD